MDAIRDRFARMSQAHWFRDAYEGKSLFGAT